MTIGIICEYNPFHNGHLYHINTIKEMYPDSLIVLVLSGPFMERGEASVLNKWNKTDIALNYVDLVIELPFPFATQSADVFARGAIEILHYMKVDKLIFGSESNNIDMLKDIASIQYTEEYNEKIKKYLSNGLSYPLASSKAINDLTPYHLDNPNDILGVSYVKAINDLKSNIEPLTIQRTNDYHSFEITSDIISASAIRNLLINNEDIKNFVPDTTYKYLNQKLFFTDEYWPLIKYKILSEPNLKQYHTVDEGIENVLKKEIVKSNTLEEFIINVKSKRYTYNRIKRMCIHILCNFTKEEAEKFKDIKYIRILGFNQNGQKYLNQIKKDIEIPIVTNYSNIISDMLDLEFRVNSIYASILNEKDRNNLIEIEYKNFPIIK